MGKIDVTLVGDAMIGGAEFKTAAQKYLGSQLGALHVDDWVTSWDELQRRRLEVEKKGPEIEGVPACIAGQAAQAEILAGLFVPVSSALMAAMPRLRIAGVSRAGVENVNIPEATKRGILVFNVEGRNAEAVSDFAVGLMLSECRNIARAFHAIKSGTWRKEFSNSDWVPELKGKTVGILGFGYIGRLVAQKLSGFKVELLVYDPFVSEEVLTEYGAKRVELAELFRGSDFISIHARLDEKSKGLVSAALIDSMKPTAYLVNTARAGLVDQKALAKALAEKRIAGAGLDVFSNEPLEDDSEFRTLDNVTLTTHIAGTTREALSGSPGLLLEDIAKLLEGGRPRFVKNPEVLEDPRFSSWLAGVKK